MTSTNLAKISLVTSAPALHFIGDEITVGKDILELITGAMYADPLSIYREYIQNAADSIDEAASTGLYERSKVAPKVSINLDRQTRSVTITDNGLGVPNSEFVNRLTAIGGSKKRGESFRGFRGVGRLSGLGYCQEVVFRSRSAGDKRVSEIHWDGRQLREVLRDKNFAGGLADAIRAIAQTSTSAGSEFPQHFFQVELKKVARVKNDLLLNDEVVREYIAQVGPVGFHPDFSFTTKIKDFLARFGTGGAFTIELNDGRGAIYRPYRDEMQFTDKQTDRLREPEFFEVPGLCDGTMAVGWVLHHSYFGAWPRRSGIGGIRARIGNIQIGGGDLFAGNFVEPRFNQWCVGEVHVLGDHLTPNGRRDDFEYSAHYENFIGHLSTRLVMLMRICRERSELRHKLKTANQHVRRVRQALDALRARNASPLARKVAEWKCLEALRDLERVSKARALSETEQSLIMSEHALLSQDLAKHASRHAGRDPFRMVNSRRRKDVEDLVRLIFERIRNQKKAEEIARRVLYALR